MPKWLISCQYEGLQPQWKMTQQLGTQTWVDMTKVLTKNTETINAFSSHVITTKANTAHTGKRIDMMTQVLRVEDGSLPQGLMVQNVYTQAEKGEQNAIMVVRTALAYSHTLRKRTPVVRAVEVTWVQEPLAQIALTEVMGEVEDNSHQMPKLTMKQRQEKFLEELDLSRLESWPPELAASTQYLLAEYHDVFSLEPSECGCSHSTEHVIKATDDTPFKE